MIRARSFQKGLIFLTAVMLAACGNKQQVDVSGIKLQLNVHRFDQDMNSLSPANLSQKAPELQKKYGAFYSDYMEKMLSVGSTADTGYYENLRTVLSNEDYKALKEAVNEKYQNFQPTAEQLTDAFKHVKYYFPGQKIPRIVTFLSGFTVQVPVGNDYLGIGLDMFLGAHSKFYPALKESIPYYISRRFTRENITPRVMEAFVREDMFPEPDNDKTLLDKMVYNGKILYLMDRFMPQVDDSLKLGYTARQLDWCKSHESDIWGYFLQENLLFETDYMNYQKYLTDAPFTPGIGDQSESAPKLALYTGWQIVRKYMDRNPELSLQDLMKEQDSQKILRESKYKPRQG